MATPTKIEGSTMIVRVLAEQGVKIIFGYSGGAILPTYDAVFRYISTCSASAVPTKRTSSSNEPIT